MQHMPFKQEFRMPLQAKEESVRRMFNRLHDSIGSRRAGDESRSDHFHRLVMRTVHLHARSLDDSTEQAAGFDGDTVGYLIRRWDLPMLQRLGNLRGNILVEAAPTGNVHRLHAPADGQGGDAVAQSETDEAQFKVGSPFGHNWEGVSLPLSIQRGVQVWSATRQKEPIDPLKEPPARGPICDERQNDWHAAEFLDSADIASTQKIRGFLTAPLLTIAGIEVGRDSNDGFHASEWVPMGAAQVPGERTRPHLVGTLRGHRESESAYRPSGVLV